MALQPSSYIVVPRVCETPRARLVCFPHSGGGASTFTALAEQLGEKGVEVIAIAAPGREKRINERLIVDWLSLVEEICEALKSSGVIDGPPYAFFGHSLGALLAYEAARWLDADLTRGRPRPIHLFPSAHGSPATAGAARAAAGGDIPWGSMHTLSDDELLAAVGKFGFLPAELSSNTELLAIVLPVLKADFQVYETYEPDANRKPLSIPITAFGGSDDISLPVDLLSTWKQETGGDFRSPRVFTGGHFFIETSLDQVSKSIVEELDMSLNALPRSVLASTFSVPEICETQLVQDVILERAKLNPDSEAVVDDFERVTYQELVSRAELLAMNLQARFLQGSKGDVVALVMPHDATYVVSMLAIFLAAGKLIVIEAHFNPEMCKEICEETNTKVAIASSKHAPKFQDVINCQTIILEGAWPEEMRAQGLRAELPRAGVQDVCILMMTSGTTGRPKTIAGSHYFMHLGQHAKAQLLPYDADDDREAFSVMFVWEVLRPLLYGLTSFVLPDEAVLDTNIFVDRLEDHRITRVLTTPALLATIFQYSSQDIDFRLLHMRTWLTCGEVLPMSTVHKFRELLPECKLVNDYSSWEAADVSYAIVSPEPAYEPSRVFAAAGVIAPGGVVVIVDPDTKAVLPKGNVGEVYVGGSAISSGYYLKPEATSERFVDGFTDEMHKVWQGKWYKSGDAGRIVGDPGFLELRGRMDSTVKIRGFKVGIPVVEGFIQEIQGVALCGVVPLYSAPGIVDSLACFIRPADGIDFEHVLQNIKQEAPKKMPRWMMPSNYKPMPEEAFSGGESRKLDRKKLASLAQASKSRASLIAIDAGDLAELNEEDNEIKVNVQKDGIRAVVRAVWAKALNLNEQSLDLEENFFDLGGHSTLAAHMAADLANVHGLPVTVLDIYSNSTLGALLNLLDPQDNIDTDKTSDIQRQLTRLAPEMKDGLAIVGMAGVFPGADDVDAFWQNLRNAAVSATFLSKELLLKKGLPEETLNNKEFVPCGYKINDADKFDHNIFGIGRHEASLMDPQHRVFIEASWAAMENAALAPRTGLDNTVVGVFAAAGIDGYLIHHLEGMPLKDTMEPGDIFLAEIGNEKDYIATRVAYLLNFTGPAMNVNSACSSALVACAQAGAAIASGQCDAAVAGASSITFPNLGYRYQDGLVNSVDGYVRPFDAAADGTVFGDAAGALVIRRKEDVSNDLIWGLMKGFAVSNDGGRKAGYAAPSSAGQAQAIRSALQMMKADPWSVSYVECHATGTRIGDGIEIRGLIDAFKQVGGKPHADTQIALGSVKGNIAHANCAAGVTGLAKVLLMMRSRELTPTANFKNLNPKIDLSGSPFHINTEVCRWTAGDKPLRAGVSSFGIGGTNAHIVTEEPPKVKPADTSAIACKFQVLPFSAKSPGALRRAALNVSAKLRKTAAEDVADADSSAPLADAAYTLQTGRSELPLRKALVVRTEAAQGKEAATLADHVDAAAALVENGMPDEEELEDIEDAIKRPPVVFVFPGQGSQYFGMGKGLYKDLPLFREAADKCCDLLSSPTMLGFDLRPILFSDDGDKEKEKQREAEFNARPSVLQPSLFIIEYSLAQVFLALGVSPVATGGHSLGEYSAAVVGGLLSLESACAIVAARAKSTETLAEDGSMLSVADWPQNELDSIARGDRPGLWLAAVNSPVHAVISGETAAVDALDAELKQAGRKSTKLQVQKAFHSGLIAKAADTLKGLGQPTEADGSIRVTSNFTGEWMSADMLKEGSYWTNHMRGAVLWRDNAQKLLSQCQPAVVLEVGPGNTLSILTKKCVPKSTTMPAFMQGMRHVKATGTHDVEALLGAVAQLWETGCAIDWQALHTKVLALEVSPSAMRLPTYSFDRTSLWVNPERSVYVDVTDSPAPAQYVVNAQTEANAKAPPKTANSSGVPVNPLVRFSERSGSEPAIKAYCLPFASGSSLLFAPWAENADDVVEVVGFELPGRGGRSDDEMPGNDEQDAKLLDAFIEALLADLRGAQYVLVGFSMGGNLTIELAMRLAEKGAPLPLALYVAGRKPPASSPNSIAGIDMTNEELAQYAFAPPEVANSPEFVEHVVPLLRADLELDNRVERRLSLANMSGQGLPKGVALELFCGVTDDVAPFTEAPGWQRFTEVPVGLHYYPGGHEFMREQRPLLQTAWRRDALNRLVQRRSAELALLSAQGFAAPGAIVAPQPQPSAAVAPKPNAKLPMYSVRWVAADAANSDSPAPNIVSLNLRTDLTTSDLDGAFAAMKAGCTVVAVCAPTNGILSGQALDAEVGPCWQFVRLVQYLLEAGADGKMIVLCSAAASGAMVAGASKAVAMEASELRIQRVFVPASCFDLGTSDLLTSVCALANRRPKETDLWVQNQNLMGPVYTPRLETVLEPNVKLPCVPQHSPDGELATYVLTGATGGLGSSLVEWLIRDQKLLPEQLVLLRRAGSRALPEDLARCRVVEVTSVDKEDALKSSDLQQMRNITGVFHLAGVLDDGIVQGMTEERFQKVAQPKCGMLVALLRTATALNWPLQWVLGFSSTSSLFGYAGQSNYCAANAMLDNMAAFGACPDLPQGDKVPCRFITVNWGPWGEAGMAKVGTKAYEQAMKEGDTPLPTATALRCLAAALRTATQAQPAAVQFCSCDVEWSRSQWADLPIIDLVSDRPSTASVSQPPASTSASNAAAVEDASQAIQASVQDFLVQHTKGGSWKRTQGKSLAQLGLDSLEIVQIRNAFNKTFGVNVPLAILADASLKVVDISDKLVEIVAPDATASASSKKEGAAPESQSSSTLQDFMVQHTKGSSWKRIQGKSLHQLGLDSLEIVQLRNSINKTFGVNVPLKVIADASQNVASITETLKQYVKA